MLLLNVMFALKYFRVLTLFLDDNSKLLMVTVTAKSNTVIICISTYSTWTLVRVVRLL